MPRSFLVKKKSGVAGMPRPVSEMAACRPDHACLPATRTPLAGLPCPNIFSPAKLCSSPVSSPCQPSWSPQTPERCCSRVSDSGSLTPEPINYSMSPRSAGSVTPTWSSPASSPRLSPDPWSSAAASPTADLTHLPFLALSFQRLQELHMKAVETRLQGFSMGPTPPPAGAHSPVYSPEAASPRHFSPASPPRTATSPVSDARSDLHRSPVLPPRGALPHHQARDVTAFSWAPRSVASDHLPAAMDTTAEAAPMATPPRKRKDGDPPRYQCEACNKSYATFSGLSKHKQFHCTALIKKEFVCKHCDKKYVSLGALKMHIRTHTLPCKCHICGKAFSRPWLLQGHVRTHTGEKPFPCAHCGRSFADRSNLRAHLQTHTDIKKYNCGTCSKSFSRSSLLHKHVDNGCGAGVVRSL